MLSATYASRRGGTERMMMLLTTREVRVRRNAVSSFGVLQQIFARGSMKEGKLRGHEGCACAMEKSCDAKRTTMLEGLALARLTVL